MKAKKMVKKLKRIDSWKDFKYKIRANIRDRITEKGYIESHKVTKAPRFIHIEINNTCNLRCSMCSYRTMKRKKQYMTMSLYKKIINDCVKSGILYIRLFALGEPLMHPKLFEMIRYAKAHGIGYVDINSNANLLTEGRARELVKSGLDRVVFSVDGSNEKTYKNIRVGGSLENVKKNIKYFVDIRNKMRKSKPYVIVQTIKMKETEKQIDDIVNFWKGIADDVGVYDMLDQSEQIKVASKNGSTKWGENPEKVPEERTKKPCPLLWTLMTVTPNGDVSACCGDTDVLLKLGNVNKNSLIEIWRGERLNWMRKMHLQHKFKSMPLCDKCYMIVDDKGD